MLRQKKNNAEGCLLCSHPVGHPLQLRNDRKANTTLCHPGQQIRARWAIQQRSSREGAKFIFSLIGLDMCGVDWGNPVAISNQQQRRHKHRGNFPETPKGKERKWKSQEDATKRLSKGSSPLDDGTEVGGGARSVHLHWWPSLSLEGVARQKREWSGGRLYGHPVPLVA